MDEIKVGPLLRDMSGVSLTMRQDSGSTRLYFSASSEAPVERFFGTEVLSHDPGAIRMDRFARGAVPLLFNHNWDDPVGMVTGAQLVDGRLAVDASMFGTPRAREVEAMIAGGLRNVSIGYQIHEIEEDKRAGVYRAVDWEPMEVSIVTVPADASVGIGRNQASQQVSVRVRAAQVQPAATAAITAKGGQMADTQAPAAGDQTASKNVDVTVTEDFDPIKRNVEQRATQIRQIANMVGVTDEQTIRHWMGSAKTIEEISMEGIKIMSERQKYTDSKAYVGLTPAETKRFSIVKAIRAVVDGSWKDAGFEAEVSRTIAQRLGQELHAHKFFVPADVTYTRTLNVGTSSLGGAVVGTDLQAGSFIEMLRNRSVAFNAGARSLSGLVGMVQIPKQVTAGAAAWVGELGTATNNVLTVGQITMSPKHIAGFQQYSRQLMLQSTPDVENLIQSDLAAVLALGLDTAVLAGTSADNSQPIGIRYQSGLGTANPTAGTAVTYADMIKFQSVVASANALFSNFTYVCHPAIAGLLMGKSRFANTDTPIWEGGILDGRVVGQRAMSTLQVTSGTMLAGDFSQVLVGEWGSLSIEVNPYQVFQAGIVGVRAFWSVDVAVRYPQAFAIGTGITG